MLDKNLVIIIVNFNCAKDTIECLNSLKDKILHNVFILVVDNRSTDNSVDLLSKHIDEHCLACTIYESKDLNNIDFKNHSFSRYSLIKSDKNLGFANGNNLALNLCFKSKSFSLNDYFLLLNPDTTITNNFLRSIFHIKNELFIGSCTIKSYDHPNIILSYGGYKINRFFGLIRPSLKHEKPDYVYGGALITNFRTIKKLGYLPSNYFLYWEETDYCTQARKTGIPLLLLDNTFIYDKVGQSTGRGLLANYYFVRNSFLYFKKYYPNAIFTLLITNVLRALHKLIKADFESAKGMVMGINDYLKSNYGYKDFG